MSVAVMSRVWKHAPYTEGTMLALLALADWADDDGLCFPKVDQLAEKARLSHSGAQYCLRKLLKDSALTVHSESTGPGEPRFYKLGVQYLSPSTEKGLSSPAKRRLVKREKGLSNPIANKEEPLVTIKEQPLVKLEKLVSCPEDFEPNDGNFKLAQSLNLDMAEMLPMFLDHHGALGHKFVNWHRALNNWIRRTPKFARTPVLNGFIPRDFKQEAIDRSQNEYMTKNHGANWREKVAARAQS